MQLWFWVPLIVLLAALCEWQLSDRPRRTGKKRAPAGFANARRPRCPWAASRAGRYRVVGGRPLRSGSAA